MPSDSPSRRDLADAFALLPKSEGQILWLYHVEELSFEDIGDRMGLSRRNIRKIWAKGLKSLKGTMDGSRR